jgi:asparagine synthase (glutamine-hydrolysing)
LQGGRLKAILREVARRRIGERVARGRKRGFGIPAGRWLAGRWRRRVEETLGDSLLGREGWIRPDAALKRFAREAEQGEASLQTWYLFVLETWLRHERSAGVFEPPTDNVERLNAVTLRGRMTNDTVKEIGAPAITEGSHAA